MRKGVKNTLALVQPVTFATRGLQQWNWRRRVSLKQGVSRSAQCCMHLAYGKARKDKKSSTEERIIHFNPKGIATYRVH